MPSSSRTTVRMLEQFSRLALWLLLAPCGALAMQFVSPSCNALASGNVTLAAGSLPPNTAAVVYSMGSHRIASAGAPSFSTSWNSAEAMDGDSAIQAAAQNSSGQMLASAECILHLSNRQASLTVNSPDLTQTLSGTVSVSITGADALAFPAVWSLNIDGEEQSTVWTDNTWQSPLSITFQLDTTRFVNGQHELQINMNSRTGPVNPQWVNWRAMVNRVIRFDNGRTWMDVVPGFQNLYLAPGDQVQVGCTRLYTDGTTGTCISPQFSVADATVAQVQPNGVLSAIVNGFTRVTASDGSKASTARLWVDSNHTVPHFGGNGEMRRGYLPGDSLFVLAPFFLDPTQLQADSQLLNSVTQAGINTLGFGLYVNPWNTTASLADWQSSYDQNIAPKMTWAAQNGFHLLLTGDDMFRRIGGDAWYTLNWPSGQQAVQHAISKFIGSGVAIGIEAIDEASSIWGPQPNPEGRVGQASSVFDEIDCQAGACSVHWLSNPLSTGLPFALAGSLVSGLNSPPGTTYSAQSATGTGFQFSAAANVSGSFTRSSDPALEYLWYGTSTCANGTPCSPAVPNNALGTVRNWMLTVDPGVHMAFPPIASDSAAVHGAWLGPGSVSDYASHYFTSTKTRTTYPWSEGIQEMVSSMAGQFEDRQPTLMLDRPQLMLVSLAGPSYTKQSLGTATYQPGLDALDQPGVGPDHVSALMMTAAALGGAGLRLYYYEPASDLPGRAQASTGTTFQTGANASNLQVSSWNAMSYAGSLLTGVLQPYLLGTAGNSPAYGRNIVSAVRSSNQGSVLMIVNGNDWSRTVNVDLRPYPHNQGGIRYLLQSTGVSSTRFSSTLRQQSITLGAGQTVVYVMNNVNGPANRANSLF